MYNVVGVGDAERGARESPEYPTAAPQMLRSNTNVRKRPSSILGVPAAHSSSTTPDAPGKSGQAGAFRRPHLTETVKGNMVTVKVKVKGGMEDQAVRLPALEKASFRCK